MSRAITVKNKILEYYEQILKKKPQKFCPQNEEADKLVKETPLAFLFGVILNQGAWAERIWEIPWHLKRIMGHLDPHEIARMYEAGLEKVFDKLPSKPRYWKTASRRIRKACQKLIDEYNGKAENIWGDNPRARDLQARLDDFDGIGQKKASMATRSLGMDLGVPIRNWNEMDVSYDVMVRRVFPRAGLCKSDSQQAIIEAARQLNPSFPAILDWPCWKIGRTWCKPKPDCSGCYINKVCPKIGVPNPK